MRVDMSRLRNVLLGPVRVGRRYPGWVAGGAGAVLCVLGWYGVSGERYVARQIPYLASATAPGVALIVAGAALVAGRGRGGPAGVDEETRRRVAELHALLTEAVQDPATPAPSDEPHLRDGMPLAVPQGRTYHRPECALVTGKPEARPVDAAAVRERELRACPVCEPDLPAEG